MTLTIPVTPSYPVRLVTMAQTERVKFGAGQESIAPVRLDHELHLVWSHIDQREQIPLVQLFERATDVPAIQWESQLWQAVNWSTTEVGGPTGTTDVLSTLRATFRRRTDTHSQTPIAGSVPLSIRPVYPISSREAPTVETVSYPHQLVTHSWSPPDGGATITWKNLTAETAKLLEDQCSQTLGAEIFTVTHTNETRRNRIPVRWERRLVVGVTWEFSLETRRYRRFS